MTRIAPVDPAHVDALAALLQELDTFYGETAVEPYEVRIRQINEALFGDPPLAHAALAWNARELVGLATYSFLWPAVGLTRSLYLKELYVAEAARGQGIGKQLMDHLAKVAVANNCSRLEWTTDRDNTHAQRFYARLGVTRNDNKIFYRLDNPMPLMSEGM
ncbi:GNAT family N-acetyltransferase [Micromonospora sp. LOL_023]|uniref:GNAT family N-acetyltransferase n=1 Tax=Micromonospora sp. LOL_023 TaxID=3345418 RepID=UPI003A86272B